MNKEDIISRIQSLQRGTNTNMEDLEQTASLSTLCVIIFLLFSSILIGCCWFPLRTRFIIPLTLIQTYPDLRHQNPTCFKIIMLVHTGSGSRRLKSLTLTHYKIICSPSVVMVKGVVFPQDLLSSFATYCTFTS